ncbi:MAG: hypothetical protein AB1724_14020 [Thermodesulfobacteriota bacterium]
MRRFTTTWRLSFVSLPTNEELDQVRSLLEPILRVEKPDDYGHIFREYGQSDHLMVSPAVEATAGEIALECLSRAHRIGRGWGVFWPQAGNWAQAVAPEFLDGLTGNIEDGQPFVKIFVPGICIASFRVTVLPESTPEEKKAEPAPSGTTRLPTVDLMEFRDIVKPAMENVLVMQRLHPWSWNATVDRTNLEMAGYRFTGEEDGDWLFAGSFQTAARLKKTGDVVESLEFVLSALPDPHLLDEITFFEKQNEYEVLFHNAVNLLETVLGPPLFAGASGDADFPADRWADWAAVWTTGQYRVIVEQRHNDKELPLELCLVFTPLERNA